MRLILAAFVALLLAVVATLWVKEDNGYVLIGYGQWSIEGSLALLTLLGLMLFILLHLSLRVLSRLWHMPERVAEWRRKRRVQRAQRSLTRGLVELAEGRWKVAERHLTRHPVHVFRGFFLEHFHEVIKGDYPLQDALFIHYG